MGSTLQEAGSSRGEDGPYNLRWQRVFGLHFPKVLAQSATWRNGQPDSDRSVNSAPNTDKELRPVLAKRLLEKSTSSSSDLLVVNKLFTGPVRSPTETGISFRVTFRRGVWCRQSSLLSCESDELQPMVCKAFYVGLHASAPSAQSR
jgi:hypothetical protein